jgi:hypothetical protein
MSRPTAGRVTFDGATQNTPQAYWVANLFLEKSEDKALSILRMLNLSGNKAVDFLTGRGWKLSEAVKLLHEILPLERVKALEKLAPILGGGASSQLLSLTHGRPPPSYLMVFDDMVSQVLALEYIGFWDFKKAEQFLETLRKDPNRVSKNALKRTSAEHVKLVWSMTSGPFPEEHEAYELKRDGPVIVFTNGLTLNVEMFEAQIRSKKFGTGSPQSILMLDENGRFKKKTNPRAGLKLSALLIKDTAGSEHPETPSYRSVLADERLAESLVFRLYYLKGAAWKHLKLIASEENADNRNRLYVYEVDWSGLTN